METHAPLPRDAAALAGAGGLNASLIDLEGRPSCGPFGCLKRIPTLEVLFRVPISWRHDEAGSVRNVRPRHAHANRPTSRLGAPALYRLPAHFRMSIEQKKVDNQLVAINVAETVLDGGN
jgi:hypothetical protein